MRTRSTGSTIWVVLVLVALIAGAAGFWYWKRSDNKEPEYQTTAVTLGELTQVVTATGTLNPVTNVTVGSQISGMIQELFADYNTPVKCGQIVAQLDPATYKANIASAEGDLANARANHELSQVDFRRATELSNSKLIAQADYDKAVATLHQAEAQVQMKEAALQRAKVDLSRCTIYSPVDGIVISRSVDVGQTVAASMNSPILFVIANDLAKMQINASVSEADVGGVREGQDVDFTVDAYPYRTFHGKVTQIRNAPITVQNVVTYDTIVEVNNADLKLKPGMTANVSIIIAHRDSSTKKLMNAALRFRLPETTATTKTNAPTATAQATPSGASNRGERGGSGGKPRGERAPTRTVYTLDVKGKPQPVQVKLGITDGFMTEVVDGLSEGDKVITGLVQAKSDAAPTSNPFGGGMPRRF